MRSLESEAERATAKKCFKYFTSPTLIQLSTIADRQRHAAYHNNHWWHAFKWYQHWRPWM